MCVCSHPSKEKSLNTADKDDSDQKVPEKDAHNQQEKSDEGADEGTEYVMNPQFPEMPASVPLTYTLAMHACLSAAPEERPTFEDVTQMMEDLENEVATGEYINSLGVAQSSPILKKTPSHHKQDALSLGLPSGVRLSSTRSSHGSRWRSGSRNSCSLPLSHRAAVRSVLSSKCNTIPEFDTSCMEFEENVIPEAPENLSDIDNVASPVAASPEGGVAEPALLDAAAKPLQYRGQL